MTPETLAEINAIMARPPAVTNWKMPKDAPTFTDVAHRDEILDYELDKAARSVWLRESQGAAPEDRLRLEPPAEYLAATMQSLRAVLDGADPADGGLRAYVLRYQGLSQSWKASSARVERA